MASVRGYSVCPGFSCPGFSLIETTMTVAGLVALLNFKSYGSELQSFIDIPIVHVKMCFLNERVGDFALVQVVQLGSSQVDQARGIVTASD